MQWCLPVLIPGCRVGTMLDEEPSEIQITTDNSYRGVSSSLSRAVASAPCSMRNLARCNFPYRDAQCRGVSPYLFWAVGSGSAPCSTRNRERSKQPLYDARCSGVSPSLFWAVVSAPCSTRICAKSKRSLYDAQCSGVSPFLFRTVASAPCSIRKRARSKQACCNALCSGVTPFSLRAVMSAPCSMRSRIQVTLVRRLMQWVPFPGHRVGAVLDEEPWDTQVTTVQRPMQRSPPVVVLGRRVGAMLNNEKPC